MEPGPAKKSYRSAFITLIILLIAALSVTGVYFWQSSNTRDVEKENDDLSAKIASQSASLDLLKSENSNLKEKVKSLESYIKGFEAVQVGKLMVELGEAIHFGSELGGAGLSNNTDYDLLLIDVTVKNDTKSSLYLSVPGFQLKDSTNFVHYYYTESQVGSQPRFFGGGINQFLPDGKREIRSQEVGAGETLTGTLIFYVPKNLNDFTLKYDSKTFTIKAK
jgi:hypothetical protein